MIDIANGSVGIILLYQSSTAPAKEINPRYRQDGKFGDRRHMGHRLPSADISELI